MDKISESGHGKDDYRHRRDDSSEDIKTNIDGIDNVDINININKTEDKQELRQGHIVLLGYGDVGKAVARTLRGIDTSFVIVDKYRTVKQDAILDAKQGDSGGTSDDFVVGDCVEEDVLISANIKTASVIIVALNNDTNVIYSTLVSRTLNPDAIILARANSSKSIDKIYKAGADYVASLPIIAGQMLAKLTSSCTDLVCNLYEHEATMLYEGIEIEKYHINRHSRAVNKTIAELDIRAKYGCTIIGVEADGYVDIDIKPDFVLKEGMIIAVIGSEKQMHEFKNDYETVS